MISKNERMGLAMYHSGFLYNWVKRTPAHLNVIGAIDD